MRQPLVIVAAILTGLSTASAQPTVFNLNFSGAQEAPGPGDPNGSGAGTLTLDPTAGCCAYGSIAWNFNYQNLDTLTAMHIHGPAGLIGIQASVFIGLGIATTGVPGTLIGSLGDVDWSPNNPPPSNQFATQQILDILNNPGDFYVNIHTTEFPGGAIRGQIPEPATFALLTLGGLILVRRQRR